VLVTFSALVHRRLQDCAECVKVQLSMEMESAASVQNVDSKWVLEAGVALDSCLVRGLERVEDRGSSTQVLARPSYCCS